MNSNILDPELMINEVFSLPELIRHHFDDFHQSVCTLLNQISIDEIEKVYIIGCGDSYHAAFSSEMSFETFCKIDTEPINGLRFLAYCFDNIDNNSFIIGVSASGRSARIVEAFSLMKQKRNVKTLAFVGTKDSPLSQLADYLVDVSVPFMGKCPGVRTYQANLLGLIIFSIMFAERKGKISSNEAQVLLEEIKQIPDILEDNLQEFQNHTAEVAKIIKHQPVILFLGSGPNYGTAMFCAAKVCEACGMVSFAQDLEEFAHVENLCYPDDMPVFILAPDGKSTWRADQILKFAQTLGKQVMILTDGVSLELPVDNRKNTILSGFIREQFSPLVYHVPGTLLAAFLAKELNRKLFRSDQSTSRISFPSNISIN